MPLAQATLSTKLETQIKALYGSEPQDPVRLKQFCDAVAKAVVDEIQENAVVTTTGVVTSGTGSGGTVESTGTVA